MIVEGPIWHLSSSNIHSWKIISESYYFISLSNNWMWFGEMVDLDSRVNCSGTNTNLGIWFKSSKCSGVEIGSRSGSKSKIKCLVHIHFPSMEYDFVRSVIQIQDLQAWKSKLTRKCCWNEVIIRESTLIQKLKLNH